jgi:NAD(P)-dependent dehydrogenase (short-subunit alcohol dehydrogenase family)
MFDLSGKTIVVTGGNGGIGLALARGVARAGARVAIWARNANKTAAAVDELGRLSEAVGFDCDVSRENDVARCLTQTVERLGPIHAGFANAGFATNHDALTMTLAEWREVTSVNLDGAFVTLRDIARHMVEAGTRGKLVAVSSMVEHFGSPFQPHYAASKGGVGALVRSLAVRLGKHGIQVNSLEPGWITTDATRLGYENERFRDVVTRRTPMQRWGEPRDLEGIAAYLASDGCGFDRDDGSSARRYAARPHVR